MALPFKRNVLKSVTITIEIEDDEPMTRTFYGDKDSQASISTNIERLWDEDRGVWVDGDRWNVELTVEAVSLEKS